MSSLFAFPGQGAQQVGMLQRLPEGAGQLLEEASDTLGQAALALDSQQALQVYPRCSAVPAAERCGLGTLADAAQPSAGLRGGLVDWRLSRGGYGGRLGVCRCRAPGRPAWRADAVRLPARLRHELHSAAWT